jgi:hypothetical protein
VGSHPLVGVGILLAGVGRGIGRTTAVAGVFFAAFAVFYVFTL